MDKEKIKDVIPHRDPFLLIDEVNELVPGQRAIATTYIREDAFWFQGHFPGYPITPGVLMVEMLAQTQAVCFGVLPEFVGKTMLFAKIENCKFVRPVRPGETLTLEVTTMDRSERKVTSKAVASVDGETAVICEISGALPKNQA